MDTYPNGRGTTLKTSPVWVRIPPCLPLRVFADTTSMGSRRWTDEQFVTAVAESLSVAQVLTALGLKATGGNYKAFYIHADRLNVSTAHFTGKAWNVGDRYRQIYTEFDLKDVLVENSTYSSTSSLKKKLLKANLLEYKCSGIGCGIDTWLGRPVILQLEHINGNNRDNRIENLCLLCPNCHSQTETYAGRNVGKTVK